MSSLKIAPYKSNNLYFWLSVNKLTVTFSVSAFDLVGGDTELTLSEWGPFYLLQCVNVIPRLGRVNCPSPLYEMQGSELSAETIRL